MISLAVVSIMGAMAFFSFWGGNLSWKSFGKTKLGVINIQGTIVNARETLEWINTLKNNEDIKGIIVRINSPGGIVAPSQEIFQAIRSLNKVKPVVASMASMAASGGYYIACAADAIVANPGTITGSIGVKAQLTNFGPLMKKIGIQDQTIASGTLKDAGSPTHALTPEERKYFQDLINDLFDQFITDVARSRKMKKAKVRSLADGRAYTGRQAKQLGLVDFLGNFEQAVKILKKKCKIEGTPFLVEGPPKDEPILSKLLNSKLSNLASHNWIKQFLGLQRQALNWTFYY